MGKISSVTYLFPTVVNREPTINPIFSSEFSFGYKRLIIARMKESKRVKNDLKYKFFTVYGFLLKTFAIEVIKQNRKFKKLQKFITQKKGG